MQLVQKTFLISLRVIPDNLHTRFISTSLNHLLRGQMLQERLYELEGKTICINIKDAQTRFNFLIQKGCIKPSSYNMADVTISGDSISFWHLATNKEDPDTLFFRRSLSIEGETETGVHIKNIMDSLEYDWDAHFDNTLMPPVAAIAKRLVYKVRFINEKYQHRKTASSFFR